MVSLRMAGLAGLCMVSVAVSGCTSSRIGALETRSPTPLSPAPSGTVTSTQLPPPAQPGTQSAAATQTPGGFPDAPQTPQPSGDLVTTGDGGTQPVENVTTTTSPSPSVTEVASAPVTKESMGGVWNASSGGSSCRIATSLTRGGSDFRAASLGCGGDLANVGFWNLNGNRVVLKDRSGNQVATLFQAGNNQFNGQTNGGSAVSLSR
ncbi:MAG: AprI/Inh family metalloprotease inhibitor [Pseudomonadota bacterium]